MNNPSKAILRTRLRQNRQRISPEKRELAAQAIVKYVIQCDAFKQAKYIAAYCAIPDEINPSAIIEAAFALGKQIYLPVLKLDGSHTLEFASYTPEMRLIPNRYGILEPQNPVINMEAHALDLVLVPLLGFDLQGNRLGMGKGYYDITFKKSDKPRPFLLGLAFECQKVDSIPIEDNDVKLSAIATEKNWYTTHS